MRFPRFIERFQGFIAVLTATILLYTLIALVAFYVNLLEYAWIACLPIGVIVGLVGGHYDAKAIRERQNEQGRF